MLEYGNGRSVDGGLTGLPEAFDREPRCHSDVVRKSMILIFGFGRRDVAAGLQQQTMVEPVVPFEWGVLDGFEAAPGAAPMDHFGLRRGR